MEPAITDFETREAVLRVDFDLLDDSGCSWISLRFMRGVRAPQQGDAVYLLDGQGRGCMGVVESVEGWYACVRPDFDTWVGGPPPDASERRGGRDRSLQQRDL